jgi:hypothetical protein
MPDNSGTNMSSMEVLCGIGTGIIYDNILIFSDVAFSKFRPKFDYLTQGLKKILGWKFGIDIDSNRTHILKQ